MPALPGLELDETLPAEKLCRAGVWLRQRVEADEALDGLVLALDLDVAGVQRFGELAAAVGERKQGAGVGGDDGFRRLRLAGYHLQPPFGHRCPGPLIAEA